MQETPPPGTAALLIESKLAPPQLAAQMLARAQLSALLHAGLTKRLVSITAPAGYGKTTALAQFVAQVELLGAACAWLSLDAEDNDPLRFMRYLAAALHRADATLGRGALAQTEGGTMVSLDAIVASLLHDLTGADLRDAKLISTELLDCDLRDVDFTGASLRGARLAGSDLRGANLAGVTDANYRQLLVCRLDASTRLPAAMEYYRRELIARSDARQA